MQHQHSPNDHTRTPVASAWRAALISSTTVIAVLVLATTPRHKPNGSLRHQTAMTVLPGFLPALEFAQTGTGTNAPTRPALDTVAGERSMTLTLHAATQEFDTFDDNTF